MLRDLDSSRLGFSCFSHESISVRLAGLRNDDVVVVVIIDPLEGVALVAVRIGRRLD
jgi:hypothetical protein